MAIPAARLTLAIVVMAGGGATAQDRVTLDGFAIDRSEVSIAEFAAFAAKTGRETAAEAAGGGFEFSGGWVRRAGWSFATPFGTDAVTDTLPSVHVTWSEAQDYCIWAGGRLPNRDEWARAAYSEQRVAAADGFVTGTVYPYPTGDTGDGANTRGDDPWPGLAPANATRRGVNGLYNMGGNAWEWIAERKGDDALTAGGSWWYGTEQMRESAMQWKSADFYAVYIGFRCVYDGER
jgi:formylglycine-generating enzyme required for sulfatase activity